MIDEDRRARLHALLDGELAGAEARALEAELATDPALAEELAAIERLDGALRRELARPDGEDDAIVAAVLAQGGELAGARPAGPIVPARGWLAPFLLAAALLIAIRALPRPDGPGDGEWRLVSGSGSALWVEEGARRKDRPAAGAQIGDDGELFAIDGRAAALIDPAGAELYLAPGSAIALDAGRAVLLAGRVWVRGAPALPVVVEGAEVAGTGSFIVEERDGVAVVTALAGSVSVRRGKGEEVALAAGMELALGGKGAGAPRSVRGAGLRLVWALPAIEEAQESARAVKGGDARAEVVEAHIAALADEEIASVALKGIGGWLGASAVDPLVDRLLVGTKEPGSPHRQRLAWALVEAIANGKLARAQVERVFELPLAIEGEILDEVIEGLALATGMEPVPDRGFWLGKSASRDPAARAKALEAWRTQWLAR